MMNDEDLNYFTVLSITRSGFSPLSMPSSSSHNSSLQWDCTMRDSKSFLSRVLDGKGDHLERRPSPPSLWNLVSCWYWSYILLSPYLPWSSTSLNQSHNPPRQTIWHNILLVSVTNILWRSFNVWENIIFKTINLHLINALVKSLSPQQSDMIPEILHWSMKQIQGLPWRGEIFLAQVWTTIA